MRKTQITKSSTILWGLWANQICFQGAVVLFMGSLISFHVVFAQPNKEAPSSDKYWRFSNIWSMFVSVFIMIIEYPVSKRRKGSPRRREEERPYQLEVKLVHLVYYSKVFRYYIARFIIYLMCVVPLSLSFPCLLGVMFVFVGCCLYFYAGIVCKENWNPGWANKAEDVLKELAPPSQPPPRRHDKSTVISNRAANSRA